MLVFLLLLVSPLIASNVFYFKSYHIPSTNYVIDIPNNWHECIKKKNQIVVCEKDIWPNLTFTVYSDKSAVELFKGRYKALKNIPKNKIMGTALIGDTYWLDYESLMSNGQTFRVFNNYIDIDNNKSLEISYQLYSQRINGLVLEKYRASLSSLRLESNQ